MPELHLLHRFAIPFFEVIIITPNVTIEILQTSILLEI